MTTNDRLIDGGILLEEDSRGRKLIIKDDVVVAPGGWCPRNHSSVTADISDLLVVRAYLTITWCLLSLTSFTLL